MDVHENRPGTPGRGFLVAGGWTLFLLAAMVLPARAGVLEDLRKEFNRDKGTPRLIVLVSPT